MVEIFAVIVLVSALSFAIKLADAKDRGISRAWAWGVGVAILIVILFFGTCALMLQDLGRP